MEKVVIDIDVALAAIEARNALNRPRLEDVEFVAGGKSVHLDAGVIREWEYLGLNNTDFISSYFGGNDNVRTFVVSKKRK